MLSIVVPIRNSRDFVNNCLLSIRDTLDGMRAWHDAEVVLMDDASDAAEARFLDRFPRLRLTP